MGKVKVNFGDVQEMGAVPEDTYEAVIEKIEYREAKEKGKFPYLNVEYTITEGEFEGRKVWEILSWSPKALFRMRDFFAAAGYEDEEYDLDVDEDSNILLEPDLTGEAVVLTVENEIYEKKERNRVIATEFVTPPGSGEEEEEEEPAPKKKAAAKPAKTSKKAAVEEEDDDEEEEDDDTDEEESDDDDEDEEDEEEEAPVKAKTSAKASTKTSSTKAGTKSFRPTTTGAKKAGAKRTFR